MLLMHFGNMGRELAMHNTEMFTEHVMPEVGDLFDDQWEDHWWPQGARDRAALAPAGAAGGGT